MILHRLLHNPIVNPKNLEILCFMIEVDRDQASSPIGLVLRHKVSVKLRLVMRDDGLGPSCEHCDHVEDGLKWRRPLLVIVI